MKLRLKIVFYYLSEFIISILLVALIGLMAIKVSVYNPEYMKYKFSKTNYYTNAYNNIYEEMSNNIIPSGLPEDVLDGIFTEEQVETVINGIIDSIYSNEEITIDSTEVRQNLENNINEYLKENNIEVTDEDSLTRLLDQMEEIYTKEISLSNIFTYAQKIVSKTKTILNIAIIAVTIILIILSFIIRFILKKNTLSIPLITSSLIILVVCYYINLNINIDNILIWNTNVSNLLQSLAFSIIKYLKIISYIFIPLGCLDIFIEKLLINIKKDKNSIKK